MDFIPLRNEERRQFDETGYLIIRNALSAQQVKDLVTAGDRIFERVPNEKRQQKAKGLWDSYRNCLSLDDAFIPLLTHSMVLSYIVQILGPNIQLYTSHLIYRFPDPVGTSPNYRVFGWHRDIPHMPEDLGHAATPRLMVKAAFYLTDLMESNSGSTLFLPGSNHYKTDLMIPTGKPDPDGAVETALSAGDCVIFENRTWHAVGANLTKQVRKAVMFAYGYRWLKPVDYVTQPNGLVQKLDEFGRFLVGDRIESQKFQIGGDVNPLKDWAEKHKFFYRPQ